MKIRFETDRLRDEIVFGEDDDDGKHVSRKLSEMEKEEKLKVRRQIMEKVSVCGVEEIYGAVKSRSCTYSLSLIHI